MQMAGSAGQRLEVIEQFRLRVRALEREVEAGSYRTGAWTTLIDEIARMPRADRSLLAEDLRRASNALHRRHVSRTIPIGIAIAMELAFAGAGAILLAIAAARQASVPGVLGALAWMIAFQPLVKFAVGRVLGVGYDYAYLFGVEPRLKMNYGSYLAAPRWARVLVHLSGTVGSPAGAILGWLALPPALAAAREACIVMFWAVTILNVFLLMAGLAGVQRLFGYSMALSSGGSAAREIRAGLRLGDFG